MGKNEFEFMESTAKIVIYKANSMLTIKDSDIDMTSNEPVQNPGTIGKSDNEDFADAAVGLATPS